MVVDKMVVPGQENFSHDVALIAVVLEGAFCAQIIKAMNMWLWWTGCGVVGMAAETLNDFVTVFDKVEGDFAAGFDTEPLLRWYQYAHELHKAVTKSFNVSAAMPTTPQPVHHSHIFIAFMIWAQKAPSSTTAINATSWEKFSCPGTTILSTTI
jgi:hypothetical protein